MTVSINRLTSGPSSRSLTKAERRVLKAMNAARGATVEQLCARTGYTQSTVYTVLSQLRGFGAELWRQENIRREGVVGRPPVRFVLTNQGRGWLN